MDYTVKDLLLHILFIVLPLFLYQMLWLNRPGYSSRLNPTRWYYIGLLSSSGMLLCMTFPITLAPGHIFDLRQVPLILSFLFGGIRSGLLTAAILLAYRFYLGGEGTISALITVTLLTIILIPLARTFYRLTTPKQIILAVALGMTGTSITCFLSILLHQSIFHPERFGNFWLFFSLTQGFAMWAVTSLTITAIHNVKMRDMLEESRKLKIVSELAASVSHEVRNPLTVTKGFIQFLRRNDLSHAKRSEFIDLALQELQRAESIITDYLNFAKPQLKVVETVDVSREIKYVADVISPYAVMQQVAIELDAGEHCEFRGEKEKFRQCLVNLAKNAIEAMPDGGTLRLTASSESKQLILTVEDTGVGMTADQLNRLGTPYYSTKEKGTGLGTMVVYSMIRAMGGRIEVESLVGSGTTFTLIFPVAQS